MVLGKRIQEEREKRGLTQDQLAQMLNVSDKLFLSGS